jgi:hypothetical protein
LSVTVHQQVVDVLAKNPNFFKLPAFKKLRAALHPLIMEQMKTNYAATGKALKEAAPGAKRRYDPRLTSTTNNDTTRQHDS